MTTYINNGEIWADTVADKDAAKSFGSTQILMQKQVQNNARPVLWSDTFFYINASSQKVWKGIFNPKIPQVTYFRLLEISKKSLAYFRFLEIVHTACLYYMQCTHIGFQKIAAQVLCMYLVPISLEWGKF